MNLDTLLPPILIAAAIGQLMIACLNLRLDKLLAWDAELDGVSLLLREVFYVHKWFISMILVIFGALTIRFATEIGTASLEMARWLAAGIGFFWAIRTAIQWLYYDHGHWRGEPGKTAPPWVFFLPPTGEHTP